MNIFTDFLMDVREGRNEELDTDMWKTTN